MADGRLLFRVLHNGKLISSHNVFCVHVDTHAHARMHTQHNTCMHTQHKYTHAHTIQCMCAHTHTHTAHTQTHTLAHTTHGKEYFNL